MEFVCFTEWDQLPETTNHLFSETEQNSLFFSRTWFEIIQSNPIEDNQSILLLCVIENNQVLAMLPLMERGHNNWYSLGHLYTSLFTILLADADNQDVINCLVNGIQNSAIKSIRIEPIAEDDKSMLSFQSKMEAVGFYASRYYRFYNWFHPVSDPSIENYMAGRPKKVSNTIARKQRKLAREHNYNIRLYLKDEVEIAIADYNAVYKASWKAHELFGNLVKEMIMHFSNRGWLRLGILYIDNQPAAAQLWFVLHRKAHIFKLAYDETWKQYSPGSILIKFMMEHAIEMDEVDEIDFLRGNDAYKKDWMTKRRQRWGLYCARKHIKPVGVISKFLTTVKTFFKKP